MENPAVLIAGAGPVGLSLALALARRGISVEVWEALPALSREARASTFHPPTLEMFREWNVVEEVIQHGAKVDRLQFWERDTRTLVAEFPYARIADDTTFPFRLQCPQHIVTPILASALANMDCCKIRFSHRVVDFEERDDSVAVVAETPSGIVRRQAQWLCAADGAHSAVRTVMGMDLQGSTFEDRFLLVGTDLDFSQWFPNLGPVSYMFDPREWVIIMHLPELVRIVFRVGQDEDEDDAKNVDSIVERVRKFVGEPIDVRVLMRSIYRVHQRVAKRFRVGRVLLAGDAAHLNNPAGGMGMNSGIHDAYYLAAALSDVLAGKDTELLDGWAEERRQAALSSVQASSQSNYRRMRILDREQRQLRNHDLRRRAHDAALARQFLLNASMLEARQ